ncbi:MAG TPA: hypothetical protein DEP48_03050 [Persephonella sp.]|uniref:Uncharacterized protein n=1 Tax=Persephonella marina (strain DSM 14350 / EX-H1) TaxID=123214 RepID=C0QSC4_PERMH|nr:MULTISPECIES: hypothetical protein [Persephonella]ACO03026.1 hypothetical protein PERMA_1807 [Persephonella marina EX-H1]HCB69316.1 hypothetical protein [Persephonella sp.]
MADTWQSMNLGDILTGPAQSIGAIDTEAKDLFTKYSAVANQLGQKVAVLNSLLGKTGGLLQDLQNTGIYVLQLEPGSGNLVSRIYNASNAPTGNYSAGLVLGISAVDLASALDKYQKMMNILTSPIEVPK